MTNNSNKSERGFTLVETLVGITILLLFIIGPMTIATSTAKSSTFSTEQVTAFLLAQEGAELAQKARDDLILKNFIVNHGHSDYLANAWSVFTSAAGTYQFCFQATGCGLQLMNDDTQGQLEAPIACSTASNCDLYFDATGERNRYTHTVTVDTTPYTRVINFSSVNANEMKVTSKVYWRTGSLRKVQQVEVVTYLLNVYGN